MTTFAKHFIALLLCLWSTSQTLYAQNVLKGTVSGPNGQALAGVTIHERGAANGAISNWDGSYTLNYSRQDAVIVFEYIGYATKEVAVNGQTELNVIPAAAPDSQKIPSAQME